MPAVTAPILLLIAACLVAGWVLALRLQPKPAPVPLNQLPLHARPLVNHSEAIIWRWMLATFPGHRVLVKLPLSRFTIPTDPEMVRSQYDQFNRLYATFTIADRQGRVLGCIDMASSRQAGLNSSQRTKQDVLTSLGIAYEIIRGADIPSPDAMRQAILRGQDDDRDHEALFEADHLATCDARLLDARSQLLDLLDRQRDRRSDFRPSHPGELTDSQPASLWHVP